MAKPRISRRERVPGDPMRALGWPSSRVKGASLEANRELRQRRELISSASVAIERVREFCAAQGTISGEIWIGLDTPSSGVPTLDLILRAR